MKREEIIATLTDEQREQIKEYEGLGKDQHFLGGPQLAGIRKNGINVGWGVGNYKGIPALQTKSDLENWKKIINIYKPEIFIEMGVASGGNAIFIKDLMSEYCDNPIIIGVDISDKDLNVQVKSEFEFIKASTIENSTISLIKQRISEYSDKKVLMHLDDHHISSHVETELDIYSEFLKSGDVIIVGDTWDEGWYESPFQALVNFIGKNDTMEIDIKTNEKMGMPCNWVFGILIKK